MPYLRCIVCGKTAYTDINPTTPLELAIAASLAGMGVVTVSKNNDVVCSQACSNLDQQHYYPGQNDPQDAIERLTF